MTKLQKLTLTLEQKAALEDIYKFLLSEDHYHVLTGFAGCGKSTLVKYFIESFEDFVSTTKIITEGKDNIPKEFYLTATTNKAVHNLASITGDYVSTIHSLLSLQVKTNFITRETTLIRVRNTLSMLNNSLVIIDEASFIDGQLLSIITDVVTNRTTGTKVLFIGDPAQLTPPRSDTAPVFSAGLNTSTLTEVVRQAKGNSIIDVSTMFRNAVMTGSFDKIDVGNSNIRWLSQEDFSKEIEAEFLRSDWNFSDSKVLAWTNKVVNQYNNTINAARTGSVEIKVGDYLINNEYVKSYTNGGKGRALKTDEMVRILGIKPTERHGVMGKRYTVAPENVSAAPVTVFMPDSKEEANKKYLATRKCDNPTDLNIANEIVNYWADLRQVYASTVHKSQGSTYKKVFIDLNDIKKCRQKGQLARLLYVAVSRASHEVIFTGDIV